MKRRHILGTAAALALLASAAALWPAAPAASATVAKPGAAGIADSTLGLSRTSVFGVPAPPPVRPETADPGDRPRRARAYPGAPPQVPHGVADFLPITRTSNPCIDCHSKAGAVESGAVPLPNSHYTDLRREPGKVGVRPAGARYLCVSCHATGTDAKPLVGNAPPRRPSR